MVLQNNAVNFDGKICKQTDGVAMGSPLGPSLANAFLRFHEQIIWHNDYPEDYKPVYYRRYVDDIFALFLSPDHLEKFTNQIRNIKILNFPNEKESNNSLPFLDLLISR